MEHLQNPTAKADEATSFPTELPCYRCGYDVRAHRPEASCPECGGSVAESRRWAAFPRRPAWKDSDRRWRRRILVGLWVLVLLPLMDVLRNSGWASRLSVPSMWGYGPNHLDQTFLFTSTVYPSIAFCIGVVLLFSRERGRRSSRLDWTGRWGVIGCYVVALLSAATALVVPALVLVGISALFLSMPVKYQPGVTSVFVELSWRYLRYGPYPKDIAYCVLVMFSSATILLACVPLWEALCSCGHKSVARMVLAPLALLALLYIGQAGTVAIGLSSPSSWSDPFYLLGTYFRPAILASAGGYNGVFDFVFECLKWGIVLAIAIRLSIAQFAAWRTAPGRKAPADRGNKT